ncbi:hypothetical protein OUZ56_015823 [Daphnia magna]|uniref:Uncharacterized protein n=1 Tax=Daphnia magna TaxID=35525 RepID=A0ABR0ANV4_9CRUS|nr:hypothetical protein OUZ56_015823 [Daphnia magna]
MVRMVSVNIPRLKIVFAWPNYHTIIVMEGKSYSDYLVRYLPTQLLTYTRVSSAFRTGWM